MSTRIALRGTALAYLGLLLVAPLTLVFWRTFEHGLGAVWEAASRPSALHALWLTVLIALIAVP
ncbi:MAG: sulfate ABC transporter, partial [Gaiellaceae bacterium]